MATSNPGATTGSSSQATSAVSGGSTKSSYASTNWDVYDPNNYMMNPDRYRRPHEMGKAGGWTYNKDWRRNTDFTPEAVGQWQLVLTPEVAAHWMPDTRRPEMYANFWTPEAVMARYEASVAAAAKTRDSLAAINATLAATNTGKKLGNAGQMSAASNDANANADVTATTGTDNSAVVTGSGTTGTMGTGGTSSMNADSTGATNNNVTIPFALTAVNGNNYILPTLNMFIDNGSFTAYTGCNSAVGSIVVNGSSLHFDESTIPSTNVECIGGFDQSAFLDRLRRADSYDVLNNQFRLKQGDQVLMIFEKKAI
jgi:heat shock protein HslJ